VLPWLQSSKREPDTVLYDCGVETVCDDWFHVLRNSAAVLSRAAVLSFSAHRNRQSPIGLFLRSRPRRVAARQLRHLVRRTAIPLLGSGPSVALWVFPISAAAATHDVHFLLPQSNVNTQAFRSSVSAIGVA